MNEEKTFEAIVISATRVRREIYESATSNSRKAQHKQKKDFDRCHLSNSKIKVVDLILLRNNKRKDRKEGKFSFAWFSRYIVSEITLKGVPTLKKRNDEILKVKSTIFHIEEKATDTGGNTTDFTVAVDN